MLGTTGSSLGLFYFVVPFTLTIAHLCLGDKIEQAYAFIAQ